MENVLKNAHVAIISCVRCEIYGFVCSSALTLTEAKKTPYSIIIMCILWLHSGNGLFDSTTASQKFWCCWERNLPCRSYSVIQNSNFLMCSSSTLWRWLWLFTERETIEFVVLHALSLKFFRPFSLNEIKNSQWFGMHARTAAHAQTKKMLKNESPIIICYEFILAVSKDEKFWSMTKFSFSRENYWRQLWTSFYH